MRAFYEMVEAIYCDPANYPEGANAGTGQTPYIAWECLGTPPRMEKLGQLINEAHAVCRTDLERKRVALFDKGVWQVLCKGRDLYAVQRAKANATMQSAEAPCLAAPPEGDPRKLDWTKAGVLANWFVVSNRIFYHLTVDEYANDANLGLHRVRRSCHHHAGCSRLSRLADWAGRVR